MIKINVSALLARRLDALLSRAVSPFAGAKSLEKYGTNGYWFIGLALALIMLLTWAAGRLDAGPAGPVAVWLRDEMRRALGVSLPASVPFILLVALVYTCVGLVKSARVFVGEMFADAFFRLVGLGIRAADWLAEHRWTALLTLVSLASLIAWGLYYMLEAAKHL